MHKTVKFKFLSSFFLLSTFFCDCSPKKGSDSDTKIAFSDDKCYDAVKNMLTFLKEGVFLKENVEQNNNLQKLNSITFAQLFIDSIAARGKSEKSKNSIDVDLVRLLKTGWSTKVHSGGFNIIEDLKKISTKINREPSTSPMVIMLNPKDGRNSLLNLGKTFKSQGVEYVMIAFNNNRTKIFFSDLNSTNRFFIEEEGNSIDKARCLTEINGLGDDVKVIILPILRLELKSGSSFVHLGGYLGGVYGLPMLFSLIGAKFYAKNKTADDIYLYLNSKDEADLNNYDSRFLQSMCIHDYRSIFKTVENFTENKINHVLIENNWIVFSSLPYDLLGRSEEQGGSIDFGSLIAKIENDSAQTTGSPNLSSKQDILGAIFQDFKNHNDQIKILNDEINKLKIDIEMNEKKIRNTDNDIEKIENDIKILMNNKESILKNKEPIDQNGQNDLNDIQTKLCEKERNLQTLQNELYQKQNESHRLQDHLKLKQNTLQEQHYFEDTSLRVFRIFGGSKCNDKVEYGNYKLNVIGVGNEPCCLFYDKGELKQLNNTSK